MMARTSTGAASARSASAKTSCGDLPPSSSVQPMWFLAAAAWISVPTSGLPVNETEIDAGVARERGARLLAQPRDDVQRALRKADLERELGDADEREPGVLGGLDDAGVAAGERRP